MNDRQSIRMRFEWPTWGALLVAYGVWAGAGFWLWPTSPVLAIVIMAVAAAFHTSLQHEVLHGHPTRHAAVNEALVWLPLAAAYPFRRFKALHLRHHNDERLTDPYDDPESFYLARREHEQLSPWLHKVLVFNNTLVGRVLIGPALMVHAFLAREIELILANEKGVRLAWLHHLAGLAVLAVIVTNVFGMPLLAYLPVAYGALSIIAIRTYCEHQWSERANGRTIIVEESGLLSLLFLNNNLHLVHHKHPVAPWYRLPALYRSRRAEWQAMNGHYVVRNYFDILRAYAFRAKEDVVHPAWRRDVEPGQGRVLKAGTAPVPARPQTD